MVSITKKNSKERILKEIIRINFKEKIPHDLKIVFPQKITDSVFKRLHEMEILLFRSELRYNKSEIIEKSNKSHFILFFLASLNEDIALVMGYKSDLDPKFFFLDILAVKIQRKGIGKILLDSLWEMIIRIGFEGIILYTEKFNEKNERIIDFYLKNGFEILKTEKDNIIMQRRII